MRTIAIINWVMVGIYGLVLLWGLVSDTYSQQDAAGRGMLGGLLVLLGLFLTAVAIFNYLPYRWSKLTALVLGAIPLLLFLLFFLGQGIDLMTTNRNQKASSEKFLDRGNTD